MKRTFKILALSILLTGSFAHADKVKENDAFPEFKLGGVRDNKDKSLDLDALKKKNKVVIVDFWASWCGPCKQSFPILDRIEKKFKNKGVSVIGVNVDDQKDSAQKFAKDVPVSFALLFDDGHKISSKVGVPAMPSSYVLDRSGKVRYVHKGFFPGDDKKFETEIESILKAKK